jgi:hypothetical protein
MQITAVLLCEYLFCSTTANLRTTKRALAHIKLVGALLGAFQSLGGRL